MSFALEHIPNAATSRSTIGTSQPFTPKEQTIMFSRRKAMDAGKRPAFHEGHASPLIQILAWLFLAFSILAVVAQFATKKAMSKRLVKADFVLLVALVGL